MRNKLIEKIVYKDEIITVGKVEIHYNEYSEFQPVTIIIFLF